ncbi:two-component sensor histidine kinase [Paenibacillus dendritiformis]|uniref:sensor histidine kinase n=1 Tax=Paenibacillus dendritiformis TaxID=130049 RepID=UPI001B074757|nr:HAMP domain-containing sensor histidine kinase [Paenibacillus dendritiformis]GIO71483.1 two-component sensor histidine kinase [Paenibacillus dendritiformis]
MNKHWAKSIRWKLLFRFALTLLLTFMSLVLLMFAAGVIRELKEPVTYRIINFLAFEVGVVPTMVIAGIILFILFYVLLNRQLIGSLERITETVQHIADGDFDQRCNITTDDEIGRLAKNIDIMVYQLKNSIEEERLAERTKNELITSVSHDLRTPLTSILGYLGLVEQDRYRDEVELRHYIHIAYEKAERLNVMINDLFEYTRMNGGMTLRTKPMNVSEMAGQLCVHYRYPMEQAGLTLQMSSNTDKCWVNADPDKLVRVFDNLLSNAMHYAYSGSVVELHLRQDEDKVEITVKNAGDPIPSQDLPHIFERFYRVEKSRSEKTGGSGLGLAIAKTIIELHGGTIRAESSPQATLFIIELPRIAPPAPAYKSQADGLSGQGGAINVPD